MNVKKKRKKKKEKRKKKKEKKKKRTPRSFWVQPLRFLLFPDHNSSSHLLAACPLGRVN
jgi:hypothetical protein